MGLEALVTCHTSMLGGHTCMYASMGVDAIATCWETIWMGVYAIATCWEILRMGL